MNIIENLYERPHSPYDDTAIERLRRMGLVTAEGTPDRDAMTVLSGVFAGQFYDDLCDYYQDYTDVREMLGNLFDALERMSVEHRSLFICLQDNSMFRDLPAPIWWISGNPAFAESFADGFLARLRQLHQTTSEGGTP